MVSWWGEGGWVGKVAFMICTRAEHSKKVIFNQLNEEK